MTDKQFEKLLNKLSLKHREYLLELSKAENEYKKRFGKYPSDWDDYYYMSNRFIQNIMSNGWNLSSEEQTKLTDAYINSLISELT